MPVTRYRKKVLTEALIWTGDNDDEVRAWVGGVAGQGYPAENYFVPVHDAPPRELCNDPTHEHCYARLFVEKSGSWCTLSPGDAIARESDGDGFYPIASDILAANFEPADDNHDGDLVAHLTDPAVLAAYDEATAEALHHREQTPMHRRRT